MKDIAVDSEKVWLWFVDRSYGHDHACIKTLCCLYLNYGFND